MEGASEIFLAWAIPGKPYQAGVIKMLWLKSCSRCKLGDMTLDEYNDTLCLQCGYIQYSVDETVIAPQSAHLFHVFDGKTELAGTYRELRETAVAVYEANDNLSLEH